MIWNDVWPSLNSRQFHRQNRKNQTQQINILYFSILPVIPAQAGIHQEACLRRHKIRQIPAYAGMTNKCLIFQYIDLNHPLKLLNEFQFLPKFKN